MVKPKINQSRQIRIHCAAYIHAMGIRQEWHVDNPTHSPDFRGHVGILANKNGSQQNAGVDDEAESQDYMKPRQNNMSMWRSTSQNPNQTNVIST